jgi:aspartyl-tRNA(Asn)/glutamyl-tRNA(Gln) amidotransferase subunit B
MRCDVNVSLRPKGQEKLGTRAEIKNVNSFRFVERAIAFEIERQREILEDGGVVIQETRLYNPDLDETRSMRTKEEANDYRYFPCPDLLPLMLDEAYIEHQRSLLPELPSEKRQRFVESLGLSTYDADVLTGSRALAEYFEAVQQHCSDAKLAANWVQGDLLGRLNRDGLDITESPVSAEQLGGLLVRLVDDTINGKGAKQVFADLWERKGETADEIIDARGLKQVTDTGAIESLCDQVIADNPVQVTQYREASEDKRGKMIGFFVGQVMKASRGTANPPQVNAMLKEKLDALL